MKTNLPKCFAVPVTRTRRASHTSEPLPDRPGLEPLPAPLVVHGSTDCFVTPHEIASEMAIEAEIEPSHTILEPSAGTGNLIRAALERGAHRLNVEAVELNTELADKIRWQFPDIQLTQGDFLTDFEPSPGLFDRILMNPPYGKQVWKKHFAYAQTFLKPGGILVAILPGSYAGEGIVRTLEAGTFSGTNVRTHLVKITND